MRKRDDSKYHSQFYSLNTFLCEKNYYPFSDFFSIFAHCHIFDPFDCKISLLMIKMIKKVYSWVSVFFSLRQSRCFSIFAEIAIYRIVSHHKYIWNIPFLVNLLGSFNNLFRGIWAYPRSGGVGCVYLLKVMRCAVYILAKLVKLIAEQSKSNEISNWLNSGG